MDDVTLLIGLWLANAALALTGVVYYAVLWMPAWHLCGRDEIRVDAGTLRVCRRRIFRYTSRIGLKALMLVYCLLRAHVVWITNISPVLDESWASAWIMMTVLVWLTADTILARRYD